MTGPTTLRFDSLALRRPTSTVFRDRCWAPYADCVALVFIQRLLTCRADYLLIHAWSLPDMPGRVSSLAPHRALFSVGVLPSLGENSCCIAADQPPRTRVGRRLSLELAFRHAPWIPWALWSGLRTFEHMKRILPDVLAPSSHGIERLSNYRAGLFADIARDRPQDAGLTICHVAR